MTLVYFRSPHRPEALNERFEAEFNLADIVFLEQAYGDFYRTAKTLYDQLSYQGYSGFDITDKNLCKWNT